MTKESKKPSISTGIDFFKLEDIGKPYKKGAAAEKSEGQGLRNAKLDKHISKLKERTADALDRTRNSIESRILQEELPFWDEDNRGVPNPLIRSGLFSVQNTEKRDYLNKFEVASLSNYTISYTGKDLQQDDLSVWMSLINMAKAKPLTDSVIFTGYQLIKDLKWRMHSESYKRAKESIERMKVTGLEITTKSADKGYVGSLIREFSWDEMCADGNARWMVRFEPRVSILFLNDTTTLVDWETRKKIGSRATVALWLHAFYSSHREPIPMSVEKFHELCRSADTVSSFRRTLTLALGKLIQVEFLESFEMKDGVLRVVKHNRLRLLK